jgi:hypothetical protein
MTKQKTAARKALVDRLGALEAEIDKLSKPIAVTVAQLVAKNKAASELRKQVAFFAEEDGLYGEQSKAYKGDKYEALVGMAENKTTVRKARLLELIGPNLFVELANVTQTAVKGLDGVALPPDIFLTERSGPRSVTTAPVTTGR